MEVMTGQLAPRLGRSLADAAAPARGLLKDHFQPPAAALAFRPLAEAGPSRARRRQISSPASPCCPAARPAAQLIEPSAESLELLQRIAQRRRHTQAILDQADRDPQAAVRLLAQTGDLIRGLDAAGAAAVVYRLADRYARTRPRRHGGGDLSVAGGPISQRSALPAGAGLAGAVLRQRRGGRAAPDAAFPQGSVGNTRGPLGAGGGVGNADRADAARFVRPSGGAFSRGRRLSQPGALQQAQRSVRCPRPRRRTATPGRPAPRRTLAAPAQGGRRPSRCCLASTAPAKPRLDGRLDDAVWQRAKPVALHSSLHDDSQWPATVMLAHDAEFLYIAIRCRQAPGRTMRRATARASRDADLSAHDRVDVFIDLDRDFATYYRLTIDHRGWTHDSCCGDSTWDPTWYVAARSEAREWTAEAAIPLGQLTSRRPAAETVWAIGVQRTVPGVGFQSWTTPAAATVVPEGFGYLIFK